MDQPLATRRRTGIWGISLLMVAWAIVPQALAQETATAPQAGAAAPASSPASTPATQSAAEEAAWKYLGLLQEYVHVSRQTNTQQRAEELPKMIDALAAAAYLGEQVKPEVAKQAVVVWPAVVSHYVDGFRQDRLVVQQPSASEAVATITAVNPHDQQVADELASQVRQELQKQGYSGQDLLEREKVLLKRQLAEHGIGYPLAAIIQLHLVNVNGVWRLGGVSLVPPRSVSVSRPAIRPSSIPAASQPSRAR